MPAGNASVQYPVTLIDDIGTSSSKLVTQKIGATENYGIIMSESFMGENVHYGVVSRHENLT
ncbi:hypothetical protein PV02_02555 [Methanolobus chelungpuianus]|uniref:Uncharacterized protein n=1 Tax=Methanolobus chelungpuianus TaxID=502115 RepID=A0AAE3KWC5_9EURY|nr:hypothetical protein [Methanolobus chelungpuianus]